MVNLKTFVGAAVLAVGLACPLRQRPTVIGRCLRRTAWGAARRGIRSLSGQFAGAGAVIGGLGCDAAVGAARSVIAQSRRPSAAIRGGGR